VDAGRLSRHYNAKRPYPSLGWQTPVAFAKSSQLASAQGDKRCGERAGLGGSAGGVEGLPVPRQQFVDPVGWMVGDPG